MERLNEGLQRKLTLVSAPAGFGKTTLISEWVHTIGAHRDAPHQVAWISLDEGDNDPVRFLTYLVTAIDNIDGIEADMEQRALTILQSSQPPQHEVILTSLINEIITFPGRILLVLDDYHLIESQSVHDVLSFLRKNLPSKIHLAIATREDPPLPLARLRSRDQLVELRGVDLRFPLLKPMSSSIK
jgi:LuxR family maltose regulon positive regulatory protein